MTTPLNDEMTHEEELSYPSRRAPIAALLAGLILTIAAFLVLGSGIGNPAHKGKTTIVTPPTSAPQTPQPPSALPSHPTYSPTPVAVSVRWKGTITVHGIDAHKDLDAIPPRSDPLKSDLNGDWLETTLSADSSSAQIAVLPSGGQTPGYTKCRDSAYASGSDYTEELSAGDVLCVITSQGRIARLITVRATQTSLEPIVTFKAVIWDPPAA